MTQRLYTEKTPNNRKQHVEQNTKMQPTFRKHTHTILSVLRIFLPLQGFYFVRRRLAA